jgi:hypothetical protein
LTGSPRKGDARPMWSIADSARRAFLAVFLVFAVGCTGGTTQGGDSPPPTTTVPPTSSQQSPPPPETPEIPNILGLTLADAKDSLAAAGLSWHVIKQPTNLPGYLGHVFRNPSFGTRIVNGTLIVNVTVGVQPP